MCGKRVVFRGPAVASPLCCETLREMLSEVTAGFNEKYTAKTPEPMPFDLTGSIYRVGRWLLPPPGLFISALLPVNRDLRLICGL